MRHFERQALATRYGAHRPRVHSDVFRALGLEHLGPTSTALDVACGTGHSTCPLLALAAQVVGCDVSAAMLTEAQRTCPEATFVVSPAEALPLSESEADLVTVGFAFHWFEQRTFLREVARVLKPGGSLVLYNFYFPGVMHGNPAFTTWYQEVYLRTYPVPERHQGSLAALLREEDFGLSLGTTQQLSAEVAFTALELCAYLTTQSNVSAALDRGTTLLEVDEFLGAGLEPFFQEGPEQRATFAYPGSATLLHRL